MDCGLFACTAASSSLTPPPPPFRSGFPKFPRGGLRRRRLIVAASGRASSSRCEFSGLNAPLEPTTPSGRLLSTVLQNDRDYFPAAAAEQLQQLACDRDQAVARMSLSLASDEACLHRRISELREMECQAGVEDVMYMLIIHKFSEIRVRLVPRLSKCVYNGRLEIWPSRDWQLESIHSSEALDLVKHHLASVIGLRPNAKLPDIWAPTRARLFHLSRVYAVSISYGYFLKSASLRHYLEQSLSHSTGQKRQLCCPSGQASGGVQTSLMQGMETTLQSYVMRFEPETLRLFGKPKSKVALKVAERHTGALFGVDLDEEDEISISLASLKRIVLEAIAFGSFLWDTEEYTNNIYNLHS
ncbi:unnamed protein product [Cuscuta campestris]|uniref:UV-B-induced protein At3g17800, chloroplastic n=1 Tax=Cuscuta campestris TaxID=132261 RepID=A0A484NHA5_9ASTE|nr:unnamed protein product [Cuscuta campestris]